MNQTSLTVWNSLEVMKLVVSLLTPITIVILGYLFNKRLKDFENRQWSNQKLIEKRINIYDAAAPKLYEILNFFTDKTYWDKNEQQKIIFIKNELNNIFNIYAPLFSEDLLIRYKEFVAEAFEITHNFGDGSGLMTLIDYCNDSDVEKVYPLNNNSNYIIESWHKNPLLEARINRIMIFYRRLMDEFKNNLEIYKKGVYDQALVPKVRF